MIPNSCNFNFTAIYIIGGFQQVEAEMEAEAKAFENEKKNNPEEDDHDTRKLPKPERMRLVVKNKEVRRHTSLCETMAIVTAVLRFFRFWGLFTYVAGLC